MAVATLHRRDIPDEVVIAASRAFHAGIARTPDVALSDRYPPKLVLSKMAHLVRRGLLDYGVSLRTAWPRRD